MKKIKSTKLILNKVQISKVYNLSNIYGGSDDQNAVRTINNDCNTHTCNFTSFCTQEILTTGEATEAPVGSGSFG